MNAAEIIELIKKLPPEERSEAAAFLKEGGAEKFRVGETETERKVNYLRQDEAERRPEKIFRVNHELFRRLAQ